MLINAFLVFYNSLARFITYGLLVFGSAAKTKVWRKFKRLEEDFREIFFSKLKMKVSVRSSRAIVYSLFELYVMEGLKEGFKQVKLESPLCFQNAIDLCQYDTRKKEVYYP